MKTSEITDPLFRAAVKAIDSGDIPALQRLLESYPGLLAKRLEFPAEGYFSYPYLLWFVAENPIRNGRLPANIVELTRLILRFARRHAKESFPEQLEYTLGLVETGRVPRECGVQLQLIDLLIEHGATPGNGHGALTHGNLEAAKHMTEKSGILTLTAAICLDRSADVPRLLEESTKEDKQIALMAAAFYGKPEAVALLIQSGADVNGYIDSGFHTHASPLHQAIFSGSFETVQRLVEAGANLHVTDKVYNSTPLEWAMHMQTDVTDDTAKARYKRIETYLLNSLNHLP